ncbi:MAG: hypothetical protein V3U37_02235, partial [Nitrospinaceae bacterium]
NNPFNVEVDLRNKEVSLSEIFDFYKEDFPGSGEPAALLNYINRYRRRKIPETFRVTFKPYNWYVKSQEIVPVKRQKKNISKNEDQLEGKSQ